MDGSLVFDNRMDAVIDILPILNGLIARPVHIQLMPDPYVIFGYFISLSFKSGVITVE